MINTNDETAVLKNTQYFFPNIPARGSSEEFRIEKENLYVLIKPTYTTCNQMDQSWELVADEISINGEEGKAKNISLRFGNVPILYLPKLSFPTNDDRKSGFLYQVLAHPPKGVLKLKSLITGIWRQMLTSRQPSIG